MTDSHCHICDAIFENDREIVLDRARQAGVGAIIAVSENLDDARKNFKLADAFPILKPAAGLYPAHAEPALANEMVAFIRSYSHRLSAIGEVGLDFWIAKNEVTRFPGIIHSPDRFIYKLAITALPIV